MDILTLNDDGDLLANYLAFVGRLLADGHFEEATQHATSYGSQFKKSISGPNLHLP